MENFNIRRLATANRAKAEARQAEAIKYYNREMERATFNMGYSAIPAGYEPITDNYYNGSILEF
jgi:hypothetical protein